MNSERSGRPGYRTHPWLRIQISWAEAEALGRNGVKSGKLSLRRKIRASLPDVRARLQVVGR